MPDDTPGSWIDSAAGGEPSASAAWTSAPRTCSAIARAPARQPQSRARPVRDARKHRLPGPAILQISSYRSEEHTSELQSLMRISYAVFCLKKKKNTTTHITIKRNTTNHKQTQ